MTENEIIDKLNQAQQLLADVYHYAIEIGHNSLEAQMSCADSCIAEALDLILDSMSEYDGQPDEAQEWHDFDPEA